MAGTAVDTEFAVVVVILFMAGVTISRCAFENIVDMALLTLDIDMFAFEFEGREIMIKLGRLPGSGRVT